MVRPIAAALIAVAAASILLTLSTYSADEVTVIFANWLQGKEMALIKLEIPIPDVKADRCAVSVHRFPTPYNPTEQGKPEPIATLQANPGEKVVVKHLLRNALPVAFRYDEKTEEWKVEYREPQEYLVRIVCYNVDGRRAKVVASYSSIVEVRVTKPIMTATVKVAAEVAKNQREYRDAASSSTVASRGGYDSTARAASSIGIYRLDEGSSYSVYDTCVFDSTGVCVAETALAYLNSIPGLETYFKIMTYPRQSVMYLSSFEKDCLEWDILTCECYRWGDWKEAGKKLTPSVVTDVKGPVADGRRGLVTASVRYELEYFEGAQDGFAGVCYLGPSWLIYPVNIGGLIRVVEIGDYNEPPRPPIYASGPYYGDMEISFAVEGQAYESDITIGVSTSITFCYSVWGCVSLNVNVYKAGRDDNEYTTPLIVVHDVSGRDYPWCYWWYRDDDPMTYEIEFYG